MVSSVGSIQNQAMDLMQQRKSQILEKLKNGFMDSLYDIQDGFLDFVIWLVSNSIYLMFWAVVFIVAGLVIRKKVHKRRLMKQLKEIGKEDGTMDDKE